MDFDVIQNQTTEINHTTLQSNPTVAMGVFYSIMVLISAVGNSLLVFSIATQPKLRRPCNVYIAGLAITDLVFILCHLCTIDASFRGSWRFGGMLCKFISNITLATAIFSLSHLITIALHRYLYVCRHTKAARLFTWKATWIVECGTWFFGSIFLIPGFFITEAVYDTRINMCLFESQKPGQWKYPLYLLVTLIILPCGVSAWSYYQIFVHVKRIKQKLMQNQHVSSERKAQMVRHQLQQLGSRFLVFLVFLITFLPFLIVKILDSLICIPDEVHKVFVVLLSTNTMINPVIYGALNTTFRDGYTRILPCCCHGNKVHNDDQGRGQNTRQQQPTFGDVPDSVANCGVIDDTTNQG